MTTELRKVSTSIHSALVVAVIALVMAAAATSLLPSWTIWIVVALGAVIVGILAQASRSVLRLIERAHSGQ